MEGPLFPFGYGLSYTTFELDNLTLAKPVVKMGDDVEVTVLVTNTGNRTGDEVVQLYIRDDVASVTRPQKLLKGFERVTLAPGEEKTVCFCLKPEAFMFTGRDYQPNLEKGTFTIMVGTSSVTVESLNLLIE